MRKGKEKEEGWFKREFEGKEKMVIMTFVIFVGLKKGGDFQYTSIIVL